MANGFEVGGETCSFGDFWDFFANPVSFLKRRLRGVYTSLDWSYAESRKRTRVPYEVFLT